jgi:hypothetical protein
VSRKPILGASYQAHDLRSAGRDRDHTELNSKPAATSSAEVFGSGIKWASKYTLGYARGRVLSKQLTHSYEPGTITTPAGADRHQVSRRRKGSTPRGTAAGRLFGFPEKLPRG